MKFEVTILHGNLKKDILIYEIEAEGVVESEECFKFMSDRQMIFACPKRKSVIRRMK